MTTRYIGRPVHRIEDSRLLKGHGNYVGDIVLPDMLHAAILRSTVAHANIREVDAKDARALPGVVAVFTAADVGRVGRIPMMFAPRAHLRECYQPPLPDRVRYVGEPLAVVVASDRYIAEDALDLIRADLEPLPPVRASAGGVPADAPILHEAVGTNLADRIEMQRGDPDRALHEAPRRLRASLAIQRQCAVPMETRGLVAAFDAQRDVVTVWGPTKYPHLNRQVLAELLGRPEELIRFVEPDVGGGFGVRGEFYPEDFLIPWAAIRLGRPVKWIEDRHEHFLATNQSREQWHDVEIGATDDGTIVALTDEAIIDLGAYVRPNAFAGPERTASLMPGLYRIPHFRFDVSCVLTNKTPAGSYRGPGRVESTFVRERVIDLVARELRLDPADVRRRNFIGADAMPYATGTTAAGRPVVYDSGDYAATFESTLAAFDYTGARNLQARARSEGRYLGVGLACGLDESGLGAGETARIIVERSGRVMVHSGTAAVGQGIATALAQICGEELGIPPEQITVLHGDTAQIPAGGGAWGSRSAVVAGSAVYEAARKIKTRALTLAARLLEASVDDLVYEDGKVWVRGLSDRVLTLRDLTCATEAAPPGAVEARAGLDESHYFAVTALTYPHSMDAVLVEVDPAMGAVAVLKYVIAIDVGRAINPMIVTGQMMGGIGQGLGAALLEEFAYDEEGQPLTASFVDYLVPTSTDMPQQTIVRVLEDSPSPHNPLGVKGAGEGGIIGAPAAIANAVEDALAPFGVTVTRLPLSHDRIRTMVRGEQCSGSDIGNAEC